MFQLVPAHFLAPLVAGLVGPYAPQAANPPIGSAQQMGPASHWVLAQPSTPGIAQPANTNITGTSIAGAFQGDGSALTGLNADKIASGTINDARLPINVARLDAVQTFKYENEFREAPHFTSSGSPFTVDSSAKVPNLNADHLDGLDSSAFLQSIPNPLVVINATSGGFALVGQTDAPSGTGVRGVSTSTQPGIGVEATSNNGPGLRAASFGGFFAAIEAFGSLGNGVTASGARHGVEGSTSSNFSAGIHGYTTASGTGVWGESPSYAVLGVSSTGYGVACYGDALVTSDLYVYGSKFGYVVDLVKNGDVVALEPGDVVEIVGYEPALVGTLPVTVVRRASDARPTAVLGPIDCAVTIQALPSITKTPVQAHGVAQAKLAEQPTDAVCPKRAAGSIAPGAHGNVVTLGSFRAIRVDSTYGAIHAGDLLVASPNPGYAMASSDPRAGSIVGKALADWSGGLGEIPVMVGGR
ncbi:MAG: hypothetical protein K8S98_18920 [Planctomycetes bacterium]|nr:hypothetical protein [Planctomycetota bacterium]